MRKNSITLKKSKLDNLIHKSIQEQLDIIRKKIDLKYDEVYDFDELSPKDSGLAVPILFDRHQCYRRYNHNPWIYFKCSYASDSFDYIPMTICDNPKIITNGERIKIFNSDLIDVANFVIRNQDLLMAIANDMTYSKDLFNELKNLNESNYRFDSNGKQNFVGYIIEPNVTGLPFRIHICPKKQHDLGVKFPPNRDYINTNSDKFAEIALSTYKIYSKIKVDSNFEKRIRNYIDVNRDVFEAMRDYQKMEELILELVKVDKDGNPIKYEESIQVYSKESLGFRIVRNSKGKFNYINRKNELLSNTWFDDASDFGYFGKEIGAIVTIDGEKYAIDKNGNLKKIEL